MRWIREGLCPVAATAAAFALPCCGGTQAASIDTAGHDAGTPAEDASGVEGGTPPEGGPDADSAVSAPDGDDGDDGDHGDDGQVADTGADVADSGLEIVDGGGAVIPMVSCTASSLLTNCSFEMPSNPNCAGYSVGQSISGWTVFGAPGNVATCPVFRDVTNDTSFTYLDGVQGLDLTGTSQTSTGVQQSVATTPGMTYRLSFLVGNVYDPGGVYGTTSTVHVLVNGMQLLVATNADAAISGAPVLTWKPFTAAFVASTPMTTIAFVNGDPPDDSSNFLDGVTLVVQ